MSVRRVAAVCAVAMSVALLAGCGGGNQSGSVSNGIEVAVYDQNGLDVGVMNCAATLSDGTYVETMMPDLMTGGVGMSPAHVIGFTGARGRPGTYAVRITKPGYVPWVRTGVSVQRAGSSVVTTRLTAYLQLQ